MRQDYALVTAVLDYRAAVRARALFEAPERKAAFEQLRAQPRLLEMLALMRRAQSGRPLDGTTPNDLAREGVQVADSYRSVEDEDSGDAQ